MDALALTEPRYPFGDTLPALGQAWPLHDEVRWVRMALPFALDHINLWLLKDRDEHGRPGWAVVDCGIGHPATHAAWEQVFQTGLDGLPVLRVLVTHMHPDHVGSADWLCQRWQQPDDGRSADSGECRLWMSATDWGAAHLACQQTHGVGGEAAAQFLARHGLADAQTLAHIRDRGQHFRDLVPSLPARYRRLMDGQVLRIGGHDWHAIAGYGHAPEHIALHCPALNLLISGDMVLPRISTNVSVTNQEPEADPLPLYLQSLRRYEPLPADTLVLPSHGKPFLGLHARLAALHQHHADRLAEAEAACAQAPCSAADLLPVLFRRPLDAHQTAFAMGESLAHLHALQSQGRVRVVPGADGVIRFAAPAGPAQSPADSASGGLSR